MQNFFLHRDKPKNNLVSDLGLLEAAVKILMGCRIVVYFCFLNCPHGIITNLLTAARI